jgi:hypothetical protein
LFVGLFDTGTVPSTLVPTGTSDAGAKLALFGVVVSGWGFNPCWDACCLFVDFCLCWLVGFLKCLMSFMLVKRPEIVILNGGNAGYARFGFIWLWPVCCPDLWVLVETLIYAF